MLKMKLIMNFVSIKINNMNKYLEQEEKLHYKNHKAAGSHRILCIILVSFEKIRNSPKWKNVA